MCQLFRFLRELEIQVFEMKSAEVKCWKSTGVSVEYPGANTANQIEHSCRLSWPWDGLGVMCFQLSLSGFALLLDREKQEPGKNAVMAALVRWDHGERRGEEATLGSG